MRGSRLALALWVLTGLAHAGYDDFESGLGGWTASGLWHLATSSACVGAHSGSASVYLGREGACNYDDGAIKDALLSSAPVVLSDPVTAYLSFWTRYEIESLDPTCYDQMWVEVSNNAGVSWSRLLDLGPASDPVGGGLGAGLASVGGLGGASEWTFHLIDMRAFVGSTCQVRFRFLSSGTQGGEGLCGPPDAQLDAYLGWAIDDVAFGVAPPGALALQKSASAALKAPGETVTYSLVWTSLSAAPRSLDIWDSLPAGSSLLWADNGGALSGVKVLWSIAAPSAGTGTLRFAATAPASPAPPWEWVNQASGGDTLGTADSARVSVKVRSPGVRLVKSARPATVVSGSAITFTITLENNSASTLTSVEVEDLLPGGLVLRGSQPSMASAGRFNVGSVAPGETRVFTLWGNAFGSDQQRDTNAARCWSAGVIVAQAQADYSISRPPEPLVQLKGIYPNPAPSDKPGLSQSAFVVYEVNQAMPLRLDIFTVAGEKLRSIELPIATGRGQVEWDLKNEAGAGVASGIYVFRLWAPLEILPRPQVFGQIAVLR